MPAFSLQDEQQGGDAILVVAGELDLFTAPELRERLRRLIDLHPPRLIVDLTDCSFIDASGCHAILIAARRLATHAGRIAVVNSNPAVARVFAVMGLAELFPVVATRAEAVAALRTSGR